MRTALITILAGIGMLGSAAAAEQETERWPVMSGQPYHSENTQIQLPLPASPQVVTQADHGRAFLPENRIRVTSRDPTTVRIERFHDEYLTAPVFAD